MGAGCRKHPRSEGIDYRLSQLVQAFWKGEFESGGNPACYLLITTDGYGTEYPSGLALNDRGEAVSRDEVPQSREVLLWVLWQFQDVSPDLKLPRLDWKKTDGKFIQDLKPILEWLADQPITVYGAMIRKAYLEPMRIGPADLARWFFRRGIVVPAAFARAAVGSETPAATGQPTRPVGRPGIKQTALYIFAGRRQRGEPLAATQIDEARAIVAEWPDGSTPKPETVSGQIAAAYQEGRADKLADKCPDKL